MVFLKVPFLEFAIENQPKTRKNMPKKRKNNSFLRKILFIVRFMTHNVWYNENTKGELDPQGKFTLNVKRRLENDR